nr:hypothetical protein [Nannocystis pusilla]
MASASRASTGVCVTSDSTLPSRIITTRLVNSAMSGSWVTRTMVMPERPSSWNSAMISMLVRESRLPVGSSARMTLGRLTIARAMATRCCWPPDSCAGVWSSRLPRPTFSSEAIARSRRSAAPTPAYTIGSSTFSCALVRASRLKLWNTKPSTLLRTVARSPRPSFDTSLPASL